MTRPPGGGIEGLRAAMSGPVGVSGDAGMTRQEAFGTVTSTGAPRWSPAARRPAMLQRRSGSPASRGWSPGVYGDDWSRQRRADRCDSHVETVR
jgi:hypothetical protein